MNGRTFFHKFYVEGLGELHKQIDKEYPTAKIVSIIGG